MYLLGQICGIIGTIITIIQPQFRSKVQILVCGILVNAMSSLNFALIGQTGSAVFLCLIAIVQSIISIWHEKHNTKVSSFESILFFFLYVGFGLFGMISAEGFVWEISRKNALELLPIIGALMLMLSVFAKKERKSSNTKYPAFWYQRKKNWYQFAGFLLSGGYLRWTKTKRN